MTDTPEQENSIRDTVAKLRAALATPLRIVRKSWPYSNLQQHIALVKFGLEIERARRASEEEGRNEWTD